jgi:hypothetical protein
LSSYLFFIGHKNVQVGSRSGQTRTKFSLLDPDLYLIKEINGKKCFFETDKSRCYVVRTVSYSFRIKKQTFTKDRETNKKLIPAQASRLPSSSVADPNPGSGVLMTPGSGTEKNRIRVRDPGSGMNIPDHISESLKQFFGLMRIRNLSNPGSGMEKFGSGIRNKHPGSATQLLTQLP